MAPVMPSTQNGRTLGEWVGTSVKMLADLLLLLPPASHLAHSRARHRKQEFHLPNIGFRNLELQNQS